MIDSEIEMKELGRKHPANTHNKTSLIRTSQYVTDVVQPEESNRWKGINRHTQLISRNTGRRGIL